MRSHSLVRRSSRSFRSALAMAASKSRSGMKESLTLPVDSPAGDPAMIRTAFGKIGVAIFVLVLALVIAGHSGQFPLP